ncbi:uncharacterized protein LOC111621366 [Centruroides sculpturatus]|uniref:uncharacterized protein LOC111621366 n=1 Tax=Centruroides sculpturatus TaxID=218467 RepID=UPI000C6ED578|nr:uncharacterized protein LOC111621366 [Centruroides sculpturatus]
MENLLDFSKSVLLELPRASGHFTQKDFVTALQDTVDSKDIIGLGPLQQKWKWILTLNNEEVRSLILNLGEIEVSGSKCIIKPVIEDLVEGKVHWLPLEVPDSYLRSILEKFCDKIEIRKEKSNEPGLEHILSGKRLVTLKLKKGFNVDMLPHTFILCNFPALLVIKNRVPRCLRCSQTGHIKKNCSTPFCSKCKNFGHDTLLCVGPTYASRLRKSATEIQYKSDDSKRVETKEKLQQENNETNGPEISTDKPEEINNTEGFKLVQTKKNKRKGSERTKNITSNKLANSEISSDTKLNNTCRDKDPSKRIRKTSLSDESIKNNEQSNKGNSMDMEYEHFDISDEGSQNLSSWADIMTEDTAGDIDTPAEYKIHETQT